MPVAIGEDPQVPIPAGPERTAYRITGNAADAEDVLQTPLEKKRL